MTVQVDISRKSKSFDVTEAIEWLEANIGQGQSVDSFNEKPKTWAYPGSTLTHTPFLIADANKAMLFKLIWG